MKGPPECQPRMCKSCIFREDGKAVELRPGRLDEIRAYLLTGTTHYCHQPAMTGSDKEIACRGGRDYQLTIWSRMGIIAGPTDAALAAAMAAMPERRERVTNDAPKTRGNSGPGPGPKNCPDCHAGLGEIHRDGCDVEACPACGGQLLSCDCPSNSPQWKERWEARRIAWSGEFPGVAECREFGWWCQRNPDGPGYVPVPAGTPGAYYNLNKLAVDATWDADAGRW